MKDELEKLLGEARDDSLRLFDIGRCALREGDVRTAVRALEHARVLTPAHNVTIFLLALAYFKAGDLIAALEAVDEVLDLCPRHPGAQLLKLRCCAGLAQWEEIQLMEAAATISVGDSWEARFLFALGREHLELDHTLPDILETMPPKARRRILKDYGHLGRKAPGA
ncbi:MAG: hypothetical protein KIT74_11015 [Fimbriimonadales bacterium]|nr:hypothetical protein [Fimbriimonadales bacterium]